MSTPLENVVGTLLEQQELIVDLAGFGEPPMPRPPVDATLLVRLEEWWVATTGEPLPDSYRQFLLICDGIENFSVSYSLFGARDLLAPSYRSLLEQVLARGIGFDFDPLLPPIMVAYDPETTTRIFFEARHQRDVHDEPVVLEGDPGNLTLHQSFKTFLEARVDANLFTMAKLKDVAEGRVEEE